ncbi:MAG: phospholipase D-like domain-containing protein [Janthinobacterium lividum]
MKLIVQPDDGIDPILTALQRAKKSIQILIFRYDRSEIERALVEAVQRGVTVQALIAFTNRGDEKNLRKLEMRLLEHGITVSRTADDLVRYHGKMFLIDHKELYLLAFNYTHLDIMLSRSFAAAITDKVVVAEATRLFESDVHRTPFISFTPQLVVSPVNARKELTNFINGAKKQLLLYEMKISDPDFIRLLREKTAQGVDVRIIGRTGEKTSQLPLRVLPMRLHARAIIRDGKAAFLGSQSLRKLELEARREIGVIFTEAAAIKKMVGVFEHDWASAKPLATNTLESAMEIPVRRVAKIVAKHIHVKPVVEQLLDRVLERSSSDVPFEPGEVANTVREAFREEIHDAVLLALRDMASHAAHLPLTRAIPEK